MKTSSVVVQSWWRGVSQRRKLTGQVAKVVTCQAVVRGWVQVQQFKRMKNAATILQRRVRAWAEGRRVRTQFVVKREAAVRIQALWRGHLQRSRFRREVDSIVKMQAMVSGKLARDTFVERKLEAVLIQNWWKAVLVGRQARSIPNTEGGCSEGADLVEDGEGEEEVQQVAEGGGSLPGSGERCL